jgi:hypothetical protein
MTTGKKKALFRRFAEEVVNMGTPSLADRFVGVDFAGHRPPPGHTPHVGGLERAIMVTRRPENGARVTVEELLGEGDLTTCRWTLQGTSRGILPSGNAASRSGSVYSARERQDGGTLATLGHDGPDATAEHGSRARTASAMRSINGGAARPVFGRMERVGRLMSAIAGRRATPLLIGEVPVEGAA